MTTYRNERYITKFVRSPLLITPDKRDEIFMALCARVKGHRISDDDIAVFMNAAEARKTRYPVAMFDDDDDAPSDPLVRFSADVEGRPEARADGQVAVIPVLGTISFRGGGMGMSSGGTSASFVGRLFDRAVADASVKSILLDVDSPGGTVDGIPELAAKIFNARKVKPVVAIANSMAASAAYYIASQASEFVMIESGYVGSIGVYCLFEDWSAWLEKEGIEINAISYGDNKLEGAPWQEMSDESRAFFKSEVDDIGRAFVAAVAKGRGVTSADVKKSFGQGRVFRGKEALALGMVNRLDSFDGTLTRMLKAKPSGVSSGRTAGAHVGALLETTKPAAAVDEPLESPVEGLTPAIEADALAEAGQDRLEREAELEQQRIADVDAADAALAIAERL